MALRILVRFAALLAVANVRVALGLNIRESIAKSKILNGPGDVQKEYDYIIVGGGTAGLTVADRLTESGDRRWQARGCIGFIQKLTECRHRPRYRVGTLWYGPVQSKE
jgi:hypothetical protein